MPEKLSRKDVENIIYIYTHLSLASKHDFLAALMVEHPEHFPMVTKALGNQYTNSMVQA